MTEPGLEKPAVQLLEGVAGFLRDDFSDANGTLLINHVPDGGGEPFSWIEAPAWQPIDPPGFIQDSAVTAAAQSAWVYLTSVQAGDRVELVVDLFRELSRIQDLVIYLRTEAADFDDGILTGWSLGPGLSSVWVDLPGGGGSGVDVPIPVVGRHTFSAEITADNRIELAIDSNVVWSEPAGTLPASGRAGIGLWNNETPDVRFTSFTAGAPAAVRIEPVNVGPLNVWPSGLTSLDGASGPSEVQLRVRVDGGGVNLKDQWVKLTLTAVDSAGTGSDSIYSHFHHGRDGLPKPTGKLSNGNGELSQGDSVNTGSTGLEALVKYTSSQVSGPIVLRAETNGARADSLTIPVRVPGLLQLVPDGAFEIVGVKAIHPSSNWVTPKMERVARMFADSFFADLQKKVGFNDASLRFGGKFDLHEQWDQASLPTCLFKDAHNPPGCHQRHRVGMNLDLRSQGLSEAESTKLKQIWENIAGTPVGIEGDHFHVFRP